MPRWIDITGLKVGRLTVVERVGSRGRASLWRCRCSCGGVILAVAGDLKRGKPKSCGCHVFVPKRPAVSGVDPAVAFIFDEMNRGQLVQDDVVRKAGLTKHALRHWNRGNTSPGIHTLRSVLNALGYELVIQRVKK